MKQMRLLSEGADRPRTSPFAFELLLLSIKGVLWANIEQHDHWSTRDSEHLSVVKGSSWSSLIAQHPFQSNHTLSRVGDCDKIEIERDQERERDRERDRELPFTTELTILEENLPVSSAVTRCGVTFGVAIRDRFGNPELLSSNFPDGSKRSLMVSGEKASECKRSGVSGLDKYCLLGPAVGVAIACLVAEAIFISGLLVSVWDGGTPAVATPEAVAPVVAFWRRGESADWSREMVPIVIRFNCSIVSVARPGEDCWLDAVGESIVASCGARLASERLIHAIWSEAEEMTLSSLIYGNQS
jgi:hypothetical protein